MVKVFVSYSSKDNAFVLRLADDLKKAGCDVWLDKWKIRVGDDVFDKIKWGIRDSRYVLLVLSPNSISSGWVDKEWKIAYMKEIESRQVAVLPILLKDCEIPDFLKLKNYADFRENYADALKRLLTVLKPTESLLTTKESAQIESNVLSRFEFFKEIFQWAYTSSGLNMSKIDARKFAFQWLEQHYDKDFGFFKKVFQWAYSSSGLNMNRIDARKFAFQWLEKHEPPSMP